MKFYELTDSGVGHLAIRLLFLAVSPFNPEEVTRLDDAYINRLAFLDSHLFKLCADVTQFGYPYLKKEFSVLIQELYERQVSHWELTAITNWKYVILNSKSFPFRSQMPIKKPGSPWYAT